LPPSSCRSVAFSGNGTAIAVVHNSSPRVSAYPWSPGFGTKYADPATLPAGGADGVAFNANGTS
jgi:hypothetical protein